MSDLPTCNCHQCTWLRASQVERTFIPKEPDRFQTERKECDGIATWKQSHCPGCTAKQVERKPLFKPSTVEETIREISNWLWNSGNKTHNELDEKLKALIDLMRKESR